MNDPIVLRSTRFMGGKDVPLRAWDATTGTTHAALGRFAEALLACLGVVTDSYPEGWGAYPLGRGVSANWRVFLPEGTETRFQEIAKPEFFGVAPKIGVPGYKKSCFVNEAQVTRLACGCGAYVLRQPYFEDSDWEPQAAHFKAVHQDGAWLRTVLPKPAQP